MFQHQLERYLNIMVIKYAIFPTSYHTVCILCFRECFFRMVALMVHQI